MGYYIRCQEMCEYHALIKTWSEKMGSILNDMEQKLTQLTETEAMKGEAADSIKRYIQAFYLRSIPGIRTLVEFVERGLKVYLDEYQMNIDQSENAVFCEDAFTDYIDEMTRQLNNYQDVQSELEMILCNISFADISKPDDGMITVINQALTGSVRTLAESVAEIEAHHATDTQEAEELAVALNGFMTTACFQPIQESISGAVERISERADLESLDLLVANVQEEVKELQELYESFEEFSEEYLDWLVIAEKAVPYPYQSENDGNEAKEKKTVTLGYGFTFNIEGMHWEILNDILGWSDEQILYVIEAVYSGQSLEGTEYEISRGQMDQLFKTVCEEYIENVNMAIEEYNRQNGYVTLYTQSELEAMFDLSYTTWISPTHVNDPNYIIYYYLRRDRKGAIEAVATHNRIETRRLNQMNLFFYGNYDYDNYNDNIARLMEKLGFNETEASN